MAIPVPNPFTFDSDVSAAFTRIDGLKPDGMTLDGVALQYDGFRSVWSANFRDADMPTGVPTPEQVQNVKTQFQRSVGRYGAVVKVLYLVISIGGSSMRKWQVLLASPSGSE